MLICGFWNETHVTKYILRKTDLKAVAQVWSLKIAIKKELRMIKTSQLQIKLTLWLYAYLQTLCTRTLNTGSLLLNSSVLNKYIYSFLCVHLAQPTQCLHWTLSTTYCGFRPVTTNCCSLLLIQTWTRGKDITQRDIAITQYLQTQIFTIP